MNSINNLFGSDHIGSANVTLKCVVCHAQFTNRSSFSKHYALHNKNKAFSCNICNKGFSERSKLDSHYTTHSNICMKKLSCNICSRTFTDKRKYDVHCISHTKPKKLTCNICNKSFLERSKLDAHYLSHQALISTYDCKECNRKFLHNYQLEMHMKFHAFHINNEGNGNEREHNVSVQNKEEKMASISKNAEPVKMTQTRSGRNVRFKRYYDVVDSDKDSTDDELPNKRCKNSDSSSEAIETVKNKKKITSTEVKKTSDEKVVCDNRVSVVCGDVSIVTEKLPDHIYKQCTENGSISVRGLVRNTPSLFSSKTVVKCIKGPFTEGHKENISHSDSQLSKGCNANTSTVGNSIKETIQRKIETIKSDSVSNRMVKPSVVKTKVFTTPDNRTLYMGPEQSKEKIKAHVQALFDIVYEKVDNKKETAQNKKKLLANEKSVVKCNNIITNVTDVKHFKKDDDSALNNSDKAPILAETLCKVLATPGKKIEIMQVLNPNTHANPNNLFLSDSLKNNKDCTVKSNEGVIGSTVMKNNVRLVQITPELMQMMQKNTLGLNLLSKPMVCDADKQKNNDNLNDLIDIKNSLSQDMNTPRGKCLNLQKNISEWQTDSHQKNIAVSNISASNDFQDNPINLLLSTNHPTFSEMKQPQNLDAINADSSVQTVSTLSPKSRAKSLLQCLADRDKRLMSNITSKDRNFFVLNKAFSTENTFKKPNMNDISKREKILKKLIVKMTEKEEKKKCKYDLKKHVRYIEKHIFDSEHPKHQQNVTIESPEIPVINAGTEKEEKKKRKFDLKKHESYIEEHTFDIERPRHQQNEITESPGISVLNAGTDREKKKKCKYDLKKHVGYIEKHIIDSNCPKRRQNEITKSPEISVVNAGIVETARKNSCISQNNLSLINSEKEKTNNLLEEINIITQLKENSATKNTPGQKVSTKRNMTSREEDDALKVIHGLTSKLSSDKLPPKSKKTTSVDRNDKYSNALLASNEPIKVSSCPKNNDLSSHVGMCSLKKNSSNKASLKVKTNKCQENDHSSSKDLFMNNGKTEETVQALSTSKVSESETVANVSFDEFQNDSLKQKESDQKAVKRILEIDNKIKRSLNVSNLNIGACLEAMNELDELAITSRIWKKCLIVLKTVKVCRKFTKSEMVRKKACELYDKFTKFYIIPAVPTT